MKEALKNLDEMLALAKQKDSVQRRLISEAAARLYHDAMVSA